MLPGAQPKLAPPPSSTKTARGGGAPVAFHFRKWRQARGESASSGFYFPLERQSNVLRSPCRLYEMRFLCFESGRLLKCPLSAVFPVPLSLSCGENASSGLYRDQTNPTQASQPKVSAPAKAAQSKAAPAKAAQSQAAQSKAAPKARGTTFSHSKRKGQKVQKRTKRL